MCKKITQCESWEDVLGIIAKLTNENRQLKAEKQQLVNELMNLKIKNKQEEKRKRCTCTILISEME